MIWQDTIMGIINILLSYALVPQIYENIKNQKGLINIQTSIISTTSLFILGITLSTLDLYFAAGTTFAGGLLWCIVLLQRLMYKG